jgi:hypothetical protein
MIVIVGFQSWSRKTKGLSYRVSKMDYHYRATIRPKEIVYGYIRKRMSSINPKYSCPYCKTDVRTTTFYKHLESNHILDFWSGGNLKQLLSASNKPTCMTPITCDLPKYDFFLTFSPIKKQLFRNSTKADAGVASGYKQSLEDYHLAVKEILLKLDKAKLLQAKKQETPTANSEIPAQPEASPLTPAVDYLPLKKLVAGLKGALESQEWSAECSEYRAEMYRKLLLKYVSPEFLEEYEEDFDEPKPDTIDLEADRRFQLHTKRISYISFNTNDLNEAYRTKY